MLCGALVGAIIAVIVGIFPWIPHWIRSTILNFIALILMIWISFRPLKRGEFIKHVIMLYLITYFVGGFLSSLLYQRNVLYQVINIGKELSVSDLSMGIVLLGIAMIMMIFLGALLVKNRLTNTRPLQMKVELILENNQIETIGFMDTGNCLCDPMTRKPVMLVEATILEKLLTPNLRKEVWKVQKYLDGADQDDYSMNSEYLHRLRFIPYQSIGKKGMLVGIILDKVIIHTEIGAIYNEKVIAAMSNTELSTRKDYHVILHHKLL